MDIWFPDARRPEELGEGDRETLSDCDVVALALPREPALAWTSALFDVGVRRVLDLSDAHRLPPGSEEQRAPTSSPAAHYGLPEIKGAPPATCRLVANPGCYPTATLLALQPLLAAGLIEPQGIAVLGASGATGAGKSPTDALHFCNLVENSFPYKVGVHRHTPEIEAHLGAPISFVTQLLPVARGMLVTSFVNAKVSPASLFEALHEAHTGHPWVSVLPEPGQGLGLRHVVGSHQALLAVGPVQRSGLIPVFSSIDNLMRGAASQALHNITEWLGLDPALGLPPPIRNLPSGVPRSFSIQISTHARTQ
jgi:N-acetyl-gamma-glutamyl-phosphate reductase